MNIHKKSAYRNDITFRILLPVWGFLFGLFIILCAPYIAHATSLKSSSTINKSVLTVGDLFNGVNQKTADYILGPAPQPGQNMTLNARTLTRVALAMDLPWRPANAAEQITIYRDATVVDENMITDVVSDALIEKGLTGNFRVTYNSENPTIILPANQEASVEVSNIRFNADKDYFDIRLKAPSVANSLAELSVSGRIERIVAVPVLKDTLKNDDVIGKNDIAWIDMRERDVSDDMIMRAENLIGLTPRRMVTAGKPMRARDLETPQIIKRGDIVTIHFNAGALSLISEGKALESGAKNEVIRVVNTASSRAIQTIVADNKTVIAQ